MRTVNYKEKDYDQLFLGMMQDAYQYGLISTDERFMDYIKNRQDIENNYCLFLSVYAFENSQIFEEMTKLYNSNDIDKAQIHVQSDLMAAARALCGNQPGIACILGTGSNSCLYDGESIVKNISPMGFILGDEGSGAVLGKHFINYLFKGNSSHQLMKEFTEETGLTMTDIINKVYREPLPNRFLASLAPFIHAHLDDLDVRNLVIDNFRMFFVRNIQHYQSPHLKVNAVGSIAYYFKDCLQEAAIQEGYELGIVLKSPMDGLIKYHQNNT